MKKDKIIFWTATLLIVLMEGVMPVLTFRTEMARNGILHLGYPAYFGNALVLFKVLGALALIYTKLPNRIKEWAYAGFAFDFIFASISNTAVDGFGIGTFFPILFLGILAVSYVYYNKLKLLS